MLSSQFENINLCSQTETGLPVFIFDLINYPDICDALFTVVKSRTLWMGFKRILTLMIS